jgi:hypothetical protein
LGYFFGSNDSKSIIMTHHLHLMPRVRMGIAQLQCPMYVFMMWCFSTRITLPLQWKSTICQNDDNSNYIK